MNVDWGMTTAISMPTVLTTLVALSVPVSVVLKEMESPAQVRPYLVIDGIIRL